MALISVAEAAQRLGVTPSRVHQRISNGTLPAVRVGSQWAIDEAFLHKLSSRPGQPLSWRAAWAVLALSESADADADLSPLLRDVELSRSEWSRAKERLAQIRGQEDPTVLLRAWLKRRAERRVFRASARDLADVREDPRLLLSGVSHPASSMASPGVVEGYLSKDDLSDFVDQYLLVEAADSVGNVILHVAQRRPQIVSPLLLAADLAEHQQARESRRARELVAALK